jgi:cytochrome bd-type quinol oxidase subunit 1
LRANISFHILFPTITIALGWVLLFFKLRFNAHAGRDLDEGSISSG